MSHQAYVLSFLIAVFVPVLAFAIVALFAVPDPRAQATTTDDGVAALDEQLLAGRSVSRADFINSSTAYMLQVSTTFYFVFWGYHYGFSNVWYLLTWALGLIWYSTYAAKLFQIRLVADTLPKYLSDGTSPSIKNLSALACILSFLGVFYVEAYFCADFVTLLSSPAQSTTIDGGVRWWSFFIGLIAVTMFYSLLGGMRKVVATDVWQLSFAYLGMAIVFSYLIPLAYANNPSNATIVSLITVCLFATLLYLNNFSEDGLLKTVCLGGALAAVSIASAYGLLRYGAGTSFSIPGPFKQVSEPWGWFTLLGFTLV
jgi:hypothetical protein